jgi:hypothetical protein
MGFMQTPHRGDKRDASSRAALSIAPRLHLFRVFDDSHGYLFQ